MPNRATSGRLPRPRDLPFGEGIGEARKAAMRWIIFLRTLGSALAGSRVGGP